MDETVAITTTWKIPAPLEAVWEQIRAVEDWPSWWTFVKRVTLVEPGDDRGVGRTYEIVWSSRLPYSISLAVRVESLISQSEIICLASGDLTGRGVWRFQAMGDATLVSYEWAVKPSRAWMRLLLPVLRPIYVWNHNQVMHRGEKGLLSQFMKVDQLSSR